MTFQPQFQAKRWTISAAECYLKGCDCSKCNLKKTLETKCLMKKTVFELVRKFGAPDIEKIKEENKQGYIKY